MSATAPRSLAALLACTAALAISACGDEDSAGSSVAEAIPADAVFFARAVVRPEGEDRERLEALLEPFLRPEGDEPTLEERFDQMLAEKDAAITYGEDIDPWLGEHAGLWVSSFGPDGLVAPEDAGDDGMFSYAVEVTDEEAAAEFVETASESSESEVEEGSHEGVDYLISDGQGIAVTEGLMLGGTVEGLEASIDALAGDGLAADDLEGDAEATLELDEGTLVSFYLDLAEVFAIAEQQGEISGDERATLDRIAPGFAEQPVTGSVGLGDSSVAFDLSAGSFPAAFGSSIETPLLADLPAGALAAFGGADLGEAYASSLELIEEFSPHGGEASLDQIYRGFQRKGGVPLPAVLGSIGDIAAFARGTSLFDVDGGVVVESRDPQATERLLGRLRSLLAREDQVRLGPPGVSADAGFSVASPDLPQPIEVALRGDRLVLGYGAAAVEDAFEPAETLGESEPFAAAREGFGDELGIAMFADLARAVELASLGAAFSPELSAAIPYLERFQYLVYGGSIEDELSRYRVVVGFE